MKLWAILIPLFYTTLALTPESGRRLASDPGVLPPTPILQKKKSHAVFRPDDAEVMRVVLTDLGSNNEYKGTGHGDIVVLSLHSMSAPDRFSLFLNDSGDNKDQTLPDDVREDFMKRNRFGVRWSDLKLKGPGFIIADLSKLPQTLDYAEAFEARYPDAKGHISAWLPGYSKDGRTAVVRFWVSPSLHGGTGTYLLEKRKTWQIKWKKITYFI